MSDPERLAGPTTYHCRDCPWTGTEHYDAASHGYIHDHDTRPGPRDGPAREMLYAAKSKHLTIEEHLRQTISYLDVSDEDKEHCLRMAMKPFEDLIEGDK